MGLLTLGDHQVGEQNVLGESGGRDQWAQAQTEGSALRPIYLSGG